MAQYVNNAYFKELLVRYKKKKDKKDFEEIGKIFLLIAKNLLNKSQFVSYSEDRKQEMISDAVYFMVKYIDSFKLDKDYPFSYFTQFAYNAFLQYINDRKKHDTVFKSIDYIDNIDDNEALGKNSDY